MSDTVLIDKTMAILKTSDEELAREIISVVASELTTQICSEMQDQCAEQSQTITQYVNEVAALTARITELELSSGYRTGATDLIRAMSIGEIKYFPAGDQYTKLAKRIWNIAKAAGMKTKQRSIQKNGMIYVEVTRIA